MRTIVCCPLCNFEDVDYLDSLKREELIKSYKKLGIDVDYLIRSHIEYLHCPNCELKFFNPAITGDERFYKALQKYEWYYMDEKEEYEFASKWIGTDDKVLDVGCGKGAFARYVNTENYVGLELSLETKEFNSDKGVNIQNEYIEIFADRYPESFDVICSFQVLEHVSNPKGFIEAKIKALNRGGIMIVAVPSEDSFLKYAPNSVLNLPPHHVTRWSDITLEFIAKQFDLELLTLYHEKLQPYHRLWFLDTLLINVIYSKIKLIDNSLRFRIIHKFISFLSRFLVKGLKGEMLPVGHTVIAVFRKK